MVRAMLYCSSDSGTSSPVGLSLIGRVRSGLRLFVRPVSRSARQERRVHVDERDADGVGGWLVRLAGRAFEIGWLEGMRQLH